MTISEITLTGNERITDLVGEVWNTVTVGGRLKIQMKENTEGDTVTLLDEICPAGETWKIYVGTNITVSEV